MKRNQHQNILPLEKRVNRFIRLHRLLEGQGTIVVAVSGGPDSVCLLHILHGLGRDLGVSLHVAHLDHGLRGAESAADAAYVGETARRLGFPATIERRDVAAYRETRRLSLEEAAREVRYAFLAEVTFSVGAGAVAVGHTLDDDVETILMHLVRGAGLYGLRGLQPDSLLSGPGGKLRLVRPLLCASREETGSYCRERGLAPRLDSTNLCPALFRNRVRREIVPLLESFNPRVKEALLRTARIAADEINFLDGEVERVWGGIVSPAPRGLLLDRKRFNDLPRALQRHLLRRAIGEVEGTLDDFENRHIESVMESLGRPSGKYIELHGGLALTVKREEYLLSRDPASDCPFPEPGPALKLGVPGEAAIPGWVITARVSGERDGGEDKFMACLDADLLGGEVQVRTRRPGDVFHPLGMDCRTRLKDFMINAGIPRAWRPRVPIFTSNGEIIWVAGWRIGERVKITPETKRFLCLVMERHDEPGVSGEHCREAPE